MDTRLLFRATGTTKTHKEKNKKQKKKFEVEGNLVSMTCGSMTWYRHQAWLGPKEMKKDMKTHMNTPGHQNNQTYIQVSHAPMLRTNGCTVRDKYNDAHAHTIDSYRDSIRHHQGSVSSVGSR